MSDHIEIVRVQRPIRIEIDMDKLTWGDALKMQQYRTKVEAGELSDAEAAALLNELVEKVTGQNPLGLPSAAVSRIVEAMFGEDGGDADSKNSASG